MSSDNNATPTDAVMIKLSTNFPSPSNSREESLPTVNERYQTFSPSNLRSTLENLENKQINSIMVTHGDSPNHASEEKVTTRLPASIDSAGLKKLIQARAEANPSSKKATKSLERGFNLTTVLDHSEIPKYRNASTFEIDEATRIIEPRRRSLDFAAKLPLESTDSEKKAYSTLTTARSADSETFPQTIARLTSKSSNGAEEASSFQLSRKNSIESSSELGNTYPNSSDLSYLEESELASRLTKEPTSQSYFTKAEITYQLQASVALRVMADAELAEEMEMPNQPIVAEDFSDITPWPAPIVPRGQAEATAYRYWINGNLSYEDRIEDGFYDLCGISPYVWSLCMDPGQRGRMPPLDALRALHPSEVNFDVTLVNRTVDRELKALEDKAVDFAYAATDVQTLAYQLAVLVAGHMGGSVESESEELIPIYQEQGWELKSYLKTIVVPIGHYSVGLCRHRALLFKVLADALGMPCRITRGCKHCNMDHGSSCLVLCADETENVVDLIFKPGEMYPLEASHTSAFNPIASPLRCPMFNAFDAEANGDDSPWVPDFRRGDEAESDLNPRRLNRIRSRMSSSSVDLSDSSEKDVRPAHHRSPSLNDQSTPEPRHPRKPKGLPKRTSPRIKESGEEDASLENKGRRNDRIRKIKVEKKEEEEVGSNFSAAENSNAQEEKVKKSAEKQKGSNDKSSSKEGDETKGVDLMAMFNAKNIIDVGEFEIPWEEIEMGERVGAGSFGTVHRAEWNGSDVAVKILINQELQTDQLDEFCREVAMMMRLRHPNVVLFMGAVTKPPHLSIVTEFLGRGSLFRLLHRPGAKETLKEDKRMRMAMDVARGINYLHRCNPMIVHRDLKSPNLLVDKNWTVKVADFGLSRSKNNTFLSSKSGAGTPEWMAPEVLRNEVADEKSDVYSFGVILWELATLQQPWDGMNAVQVVGAVGFQNRRLQIPDELLPEIRKIIESCWENDSAARPNFTQIMASLKPLQRFTAAPKNTKQAVAAGATS